MKICFATSSGGHLTHLVLLEKWYKNHDRFWVTFNKEDAKTVLADEKKFFCYYPTNRSIKNLVKNSILAFRLILKERPDVIISTGAGVAVPFFYIGKLFGCKTIYIEVYDRINIPTLTGKLVYPITNKFIVQWESQLKFYKNATLIGQIV
ncbi:PssD/Cps14F family polysaccharide biosynthesis glycosyltransferase [Pontibacillus salicampi]|uniref:PssD/Cps14F family polysaccharide biosynthesis glycosyltransferase n=1 Tax=Pontibacillus salicampi TaxID=1449801 RepID=A0ABV6LSC3_9BACI